MSTDMRGAVVEIVERRRKPEKGSLGESLVVPNEVRINGQKVLIPDNEPITVHEITSNDLVRVTLTLFAKRIFVGHEDIDDEVVGDVAVANKALAEAYRAAAQSQAEANASIRAAMDRVAKAQRASAAASEASDD